MLLLQIIIRILRLLRRILRLLNINVAEKILEYCGSRKGKNTNILQYVHRNFYKSFYTVSCQRN